MSFRPTLRIGGGIAIAALSLALAGCAGGQSVEEACLQTNVMMAETSKSLSGDLQTELQQGMEGETIDLAGVFAPVQEALDTAKNDVTNAEVSDALDGFSTEFSDYVTTLEGADFDAFAEFNRLEPGSDAYNAAADEIEAASLDLQEQIADHTERLNAAGDQITEVCSNG